MLSRRKPARLTGLATLVVFLSSCQGPVAAPTSQDPALVPVAQQVQQPQPRGPSPNYRVKAASVFIDDWLAGNFFLGGRHSYPVLIPAAKTNLYYNRVEHLEGAFVYTTKDSEGRWGGLHIPFRSSPLIDPNDVYNPDAPPPGQVPGGGGIGGGEEDEDEPGESPVPASPRPRKKSKDPADAHPWPGQPQPSFPPPNGLFDLQVQPPFISTKGNSRIKSATLEVTASTNDGMWNLSVGTGAPFLAGVGSRPALYWNGRINGKPADDGKYTIYLDAPSNGKRATEDITVDSTSPTIEKVTLTNIDYLVQEDKSVYTFKIKAVDPEVNASASGIDPDSACITHSNVPFTPVGKPLLSSNGEIEFKVAFSDPALQQHSFQVGMRDLAGNFVNKSCSLQLELGTVGFTSEPFLTSVEPPNTAFKTFANKAPGDNGGSNDKAIVPVEKSRTELARERRRKVVEELTRLIESLDRTNSEEAAQIGDATREYIEKNLLVPTALDDTNAPFFWTDGRQTHKYTIGLAVRILNKDIEIGIPLIRVPAEIVFKNNREAKNQHWLQRHVYIEARIPLLDKAGKQFGLFGGTTVDWNGYRRDSQELAKGGRYSVHCNFRVPDRVKYARLTGFGVINHHEKLAFNSFEEFKSYFGSAGKGYEWHHLVEQTTYKSLIAARLLQSTDNIVRIHVDNHRKISGFYSRKDEVTRRSYRDNLKLLIPDHDYKALRTKGVEHMTNPGIGAWDFSYQGSNISTNSEVVDGQEVDPEARSERN